MARSETEAFVAPPTGPSTRVRRRVSPTRPEAAVVTILFPLVTLLVASLLLGVSAL